MFKIKPWIWLILAVLTIVARFIYGRMYEMQKGEFHLSNGGVVLVVITMVFFLLFVITRAIQSKD
jgi:membrane protein implicated in regulation of membrane protease activity